MSNTVLTPRIILREIYAIMHQESNFLMRTNRQYDSRFASSGLTGKIGQTLDIRLPAKFVTRTGNTMSQQNYVERQVELPQATIYGVDLNFTQEQLTFSLEDFSARVIRPAISQLASTMEYNAMASLYKKVANYTGIVTTASTTQYRDFANGGRYLSDNLAPKPDRTATLDTQTRVDFSDAVKGLFQSSDNIREQYVEGIMGRTGGFTCFENTLVPRHTSGTFTATTISVTTTAGSPGFFDGTGNATTNDPTDITIDGTSALAFKAGDIFTIADVYDVHPETKQNLGYLKRFTLQEDETGTTSGVLSLYPPIIYGGAYQNVSAPALNNAVVTFLGPATTASAITYGQNLLFHKDAFAFVNADLEDPTPYGAWGAREVIDNLSMRIWRAGDIANGNFPCRFDIVGGWAAVYPEWACRWVHAQA